MTQDMPSRVETPVMEPLKTTERPWPWGCKPLPPDVRDPAWPSISIVTPSYNQAAYIEETLRSVLCQGYPNLEYVVMEDGSSDASPTIISKYRPWLAQYVPGPNRGFGAVLHDGLSRTTGEIMAWLNSDDLYLPGTLETVARVFSDCPEVDWIVGQSLIIDQAGHPMRLSGQPGFSRRLFFSGRYLGGHPAWNGSWIPQESVFWRRRLWEKAGAHFLTERLQYGDFELWSRFWQHAELHTLPLPLGVYRMHGDTYTTRKGTLSLAPCTELIKAHQNSRLSPLAVRALDLLCRTSSSAQRLFGHAAPILRFDPACQRWQRGTLQVS